MNTTQLTKLAHAKPPGFAKIMRDSAILWGRHLRHLVRSPGRFVGITTSPLVILLAMGYLFRESIVVQESDNYVDYLMAGVAAQVGLASIGPTAIGVSLDFRGRIVDRFVSLPISRASILLGRTAADFTVACGALLIITLTSAGLGWSPHSSLASTVAGFGFLLAFIYVMLWIGIVLGLWLKNAETIDATAAMILVATSFLSSSYVSVSSLPGWAQPIADWNPVSAIVSSIRSLWGNGNLVSDTWAGHNQPMIALVWLVGFLAVLVPLATWRFGVVAKE